MTRFARAKGSKASNEKLPEQPTSWSEMRNDLMNKNRELEERQQREQALNQRQKNYKAFLQEKEEEETKNTSWADFSDTNKFGKQINTSMKKTSDSRNYGFTPNNKKVNTNVGRMDDDSDNSDEEFMALKSQIDEALAENHGHDSDSDAPPVEMSIKEKPDEIIIKKTKKPKQKLKIVLDKEEQVTNELRIRGDDVNKLTEREKRLIQKRIDRSKKQIEKKKQKKVASKQNTENRQLDELRHQKKLERRKRQKEKKAQAIINNKQEDLKQQSKVEIEENLSEADLKNIQKKKERRARQAEKRKKLREIKAVDMQKNELTSETGKISVVNHQQGNVSKPVQKLLNNQRARKAKPRDNEQHQSRKQKPEKMIINGKTVEVDYVDGFPVKKEDADRLKKLRKEMISKGLPRSEINIALKLERRRAEKAFAREKKNVCFNCRKSGHNLSECPELDKDQMAQSTGTGICFKCGSTEHTHFECKVVRGLDYKFATCFICKEQGHIAKQCPDNQRGLYPKGGSCKVCGDVTHLKKDCPKYQAQQVQLQNSLSIGTMDNGNPDDLSSNSNNLHLGGAKRLNKVIKF